MEVLDAEVCFLPLNASALQCLGAAAPHVPEAKGGAKYAEDRLRRLAALDPAPPPPSNASAAALASALRRRQADASLAASLNGRFSALVEECF